MNRNELFNRILIEAVSKKDLYNCHYALGREYKEKQDERLIDSIIEEIIDRGWGREPISKTQHHIFVNYRAEKVVERFPENPYSDWIANTELDRLIRSRKKDVYSIIIWAVSVAVTAIITFLVTGGC
jgi:hypothetical protein